MSDADEGGGVVHRLPPPRGTGLEGMPGLPPPPPAGPERPEETTLELPVIPPRDAADATVGALLSGSGGPAPVGPGPAQRAPGVGAAVPGGGGAMLAAAPLAVALAALRGMALMVGDWRQRRMTEHQEAAALREAAQKAQVAELEQRTGHLLAMKKLADQARQTREKARVPSGPEFGDKSLGGGRPPAKSPSGGGRPGPGDPPKKPGPGPGAAKDSPGRIPKGPERKPEAPGGKNSAPAPKNPGPGPRKPEKKPGSGPGGGGPLKDGKGGTGKGGSGKDRPGGRDDGKDRPRRKDGAGIVAPKKSRQPSSGPAMERARGRQERRTQAAAEKTDGRRAEREAQRERKARQDAEKDERRSRRRKERDGCGEEKRARRYKERDARREEKRASRAGDRERRRQEKESAGAAPKDATGPEPDAPGPKTRGQKPRRLRVRLRKPRRTAPGPQPSAPAPGAGPGAGPGSGPRPSGPGPGSGRRAGTGASAGPPPPREDAWTSAQRAAARPWADLFRDDGEDPVRGGDRVVTSGQRALPAAPEPHTARPGTQQPVAADKPPATSQDDTKENITMTTTPGAATAAPDTGRMARQHRTEQTLGDYLLGMGRVGLGAFDTAQMAAVTVAVLRRTVVALGEVHRDLAGSHNVDDPRVMGQLAALADDAQQMAAEADRLTVLCNEAAEGAEMAVRAVAADYGRDQNAKADAGLRTVSAAAHHEGDS